MDSLGNNDKPIPFDDSDKPIPLDDGPTTGSSGVSRAPLNLGGSANPAPPRPVQKAAPAPAQKPAAAPKPKIVTSGPIKGTANAAASSGERVTGVKTFFTKLHAGAMEFLDESMCRWLEQNPDVHIRHTNITTGDVQGKKTEPNLIITVWY